MARSHPTRAFAAPWGTRVRVITVGLALFLVLLPQVAWALSRSPTLAAILASAGVLGLGISGLLRVRGYRLNGEFLEIRRQGWWTRIPLHGLESMDADPEALKGSIKQIGNDGLFAITGWFRNRRLGRFQAFVTDPGRAVVLRFSSKVVVISPEAPATFLREMTQRTGIQPPTGR